MSEGSFTGPSRRTVLGAGVATGALLAVSGSIGLGGVVSAAAGTATAPSGYAHPTLVHSAEAILRAQQQAITVGAQPWLAGWNRLTANGRSHASWSPRPLATVVRGGGGDNYAQMYIDIHAAYQNALRWRVGGSADNGAAAARILNAWSSTLTSLTGNADRYLAAGIYGYQWANAAELMRGHPDFDLDRMNDMLLHVFYPMNDAFLRHHNGAVITNYWANWDLCNMASMLAIGGLTDRADLVQQALDYFATGAGSGSIQHAVPFVYDDEGLGQWQESGRDQGHTLLGIGLMGAFCEMAWNLGYDAYGYDDNRFLKGAQYVAKYNLGNSVPFTPYSKQSGPVTTKPWVGWSTQTVISSDSRGQVRPVWESILGHYSGRQGLEATWVQQMAELVRPEGGGGDYGSNSGGYDQLGFGTLMNYRPAAVLTPSASPTVGAPSPTPVELGTVAGANVVSPAPGAAATGSGAAPTLTAGAAPGASPGTSPAAAPSAVARRSTLAPSAPGSSTPAAWSGTVASATSTVVPAATAVGAAALGAAVITFVATRLRRRSD